MSLDQAPHRRLRPAVALLLLCGLPSAAQAEDGALAQSFGNAFETIVIDAAAAAAKVIAPKERKKASKKKKAAKKTEDAAETVIELPIRKPRPVYGKRPETTPAAPPAAAAAKPEKPVETAKPAAPADEKPADTRKTTPAEPAKKPAVDEWPAVDVELARARCTQILKGVNAVTLPEPPFRKGDCGALAPVRLISIGKDPEVAVSPPAVVSCDMVAALAKWIADDIQPLARRHLGAEVIRMDSMSDYSCRMAYGRVGNKLSEHGKANALDIRGFMTSKGRTAEVLTGWGPNGRDVAKEIAAKAAAEQAAAAKAAAEKAAETRAVEAAATGKGVPRSTLVEGLPKEPASSALAKPAALHKEALGMAPTHLGGPKETDKAGGKTADKGKKGKDRKSRNAALTPASPAERPPRPPARDDTARFLHAAHDSACRIFGTTLGPEANEAHRNHFHVDMAERKFRKICR